MVVYEIATKITILEINLENILKTIRVLKFVIIHGKNPKKIPSEKKNHSIKNLHASKAIRNVSLQILTF